MDESKVKRIKHISSRKGSAQEQKPSEWAYPSRSPPAVQNYVKNLQNLDREKVVVAQRLIDLSSIYQRSQRQSGKTRRNATPSWAVDRNVPIESLIGHIDRSKNNSPAPKSRSPLSGRVTPRQMEKPITRPQSKGQEVYVKEHSEKALNLSQTQRSKYRGSSNPHVAANEAYYLSKDPDSGPKEIVKPDVDIQETVRLNQSKYGSIHNEANDLSMSAFLNKKPVSAVGKREQQSSRERKASNVSNQVNEAAAYNSKVDESQGKQREQSSKYQDLDDLKIGAGLSKELLKLGLTLKKENLSQKLWHDKSNELKAPQFYTPVNRRFGEQVIENREPQNIVIPEDRPLGTEEFYEDFFSTQKMTFNFEKMRVSRRPSNQKDYFTPERVPSNASKNYFSNRETPIAMSHRPQEVKGVKPRLLE